MASLPSILPEDRFLTAEELLVLRGTLEFQVEYRRQRMALGQARPKQSSGKEAADFFDWDVPGWTYDAEL